jgi:hypothetical protein
MQSACSLGAFIDTKLVWSSACVKTSGAFLWVFKVEIDSGIGLKANMYA